MRTTHNSSHLGGSPPGTSQTRHPPTRHPLPPGRRPPRPSTPQEQTPWEQIPLLQGMLGYHTPPAARHAGIPPAMHADIPPPNPTPPPPLWTEWQTGVKILPCPKLCLRVVKISSVAHASLAQKGEALDLESEVMRGLSSIPTGGNILSLDFFSHSKASDANIGIFVQFVRNPTRTSWTCILIFSYLKINFCRTR